MPLEIEAGANGAAFPAASVVTISSPERSTNPGNASVEISAGRRNREYGRCAVMLPLTLLRRSRYRLKRPILRRQ